MTDFEIPTRFPYLDSDAYADQRFGSAERRRMQILQSNRLTSRGGHAFHIIGNAGIETSENYDGDTGIRGYGTPNWTQIHLPRIVKKKPGLVKCRMRIRYEYPEVGGWDVSDLARDWRAMKLQITTRAYPFREDANSNNHRGTVEFNRRNTTDLTAIIDLPVDVGRWETFNFYIKGGLTRELIPSNPYGTPSTGTAGNWVWFGISTNQLHDGPADWNPDIINAAYVEMPNIGGNYSIVSLTRAALTAGTNLNTLSLNPTTPRPITNNPYSIFLLHEWRIISIACYYYNRER